MPRQKSRPATIDVQVNEGAVAEVSSASRQMAQIDGITTMHLLRHSETLQAIGAVNTARMVAESLTAAYIRLFIKMRDEKSYVGLPYRDAEGAGRAVSTLEEFCPAFFGVSYETMRERAAQLEALGESGFDAALRLGLTFKQLRAIDGSDAEARKKIVAALEKGSRTEVVDMVDELLDERREKAKALKDAEAQLEAKDKVLDQKNRKIDQLTSDTLDKPAWQQQFDKAIAAVRDTFTKAQLICAELAQLAETITELEFEGVERESDILALQAQIAVQYHGLSELWLDQGAALMLSARGRHIDKLMSLAAKKLPDDVKAKLFGDLA